jgi:hypothetical protein
MSFNLQEKNDSDFFNSNGDFSGWYESDYKTRIFTIAIDGYAYPMLKSQAMKNKNGCFLKVSQNIETGEVKKLGTWNKKESERFLELYGPNSNNNYRFNLWLENKFGKEKAKKYRKNFPKKE